MLRAGSGVRLLGWLLLARPLLLRVLPEFVEYMSTIDDAALWSAIETAKTRKLLLEMLEAAEGTG